MDFGTKLGFVIIFLWVSICTLFMIIALENTNNLEKDLVSIIHLAMVERAVLTSVCKLELGTSLEELNETLRKYEETIQTAVPPDYIKEYVEILKLDIGRRESLMDALKVMEQNQVLQKEKENE